MSSCIFGLGFVHIRRVGLLGTVVDRHHNEELIPIGTDVLVGTAFGVAKIVNGTTPLAMMSIRTDVAAKMETTRRGDEGSLEAKHEGCEDGVLTADFVFGSLNGNIIPVKSVEKACLLNMDISTCRSLLARREQ
ncbi:hypothetical protein LWI28_009039 [Acer negundo]|uniref:Uncharacterized protein n=1 Tax=Acer negundo TaxID=4023 RepID=A0AAD5IY76_ACENE|nr:hypothetical protein LWI28_009039 [Acer negundo]